MGYFGDSCDHRPFLLSRLWWKLWRVIFEIHIQKWSSTTTLLSILFFSTYLHSKRELQHITAFDADSSYLFKCVSTDFTWFLDSIHNPTPGYAIANSKWVKKEKWHLPFDAGTLGLFNCVSPLPWLYHYWGLIHKKSCVYTRKSKMCSIRYSTQKT